MMSVASSQQAAPKWRSVAAVIGLGAAVADALLLGLAAYAIRIGSFGTNFPIELVRYNPEAEIDPFAWPQVAFCALLVSALTAGWYKYSISTGTVPKRLELYLCLTPILSLAALRVIYDHAGLKEGFRPVLFWWRIGVWLGVLAIVASGLGKGRLRKWGLIIGVVTFLVWLFPGHS